MARGPCLFVKRLEKGRFVWPAASEGKVALTPAQLAMLLEGKAHRLATFEEAAQVVLLIEAMLKA